MRNFSVESVDEIAPDILIHILLHNINCNKKSLERSLRIITISLNWYQSFSLDVLTGVATLKNLKILSLGRNLIKGFAGLESLGDTLEELWISYNCIEKMKGIQAMKNLCVLYMSNNLVRDWNEFARLQELPRLRDLLFVGNPLYESLEVSTRPSVDIVKPEIFVIKLLGFSKISTLLHRGDLQVEQWRAEVARRLPSLEKLDGEPIIRTEENPVAIQSCKADGYESADQEPG